MGNHGVRSSSSLQREEISKKVAQLEAQQKSYLQSIYEDQRRSHTNPSLTSSHHVIEKNLRFSCFGCIEREENLPAQRYSVIFYKKPLKSQYIFQIDQKGDNWMSVFEKELRDLIDSQPNSEENLWKQQMLLHFEQFKEVKLHTLEMKVQQRSDQAQFFLRISQIKMQFWTLLFYDIESIENEISVEGLFDSKWPRQFKEVNKISQLELQVIKDNEISSLDLNRSQTLVIKKDKKDEDNNIRKSSQFDDKEQKRRKTVCMPSSFQKGDHDSAFKKNQNSKMLKQWQELEIDELCKIKGFYIRQISRMYDNEIFDSDVEKVIGEKELTLLRFSSNLSILKLNESMSKCLSYLGGSVQGEINKKTGKEVLMEQINCQLKVMDSMNFCQKANKFLKQQIQENQENWLNKVMRFFIQTCLEFKNSKKSDKKFRESQFSSEGCDNILKVNSGSSYDHNNNKISIASKSSVYHFQNGLDQCLAEKDIFSFYSQIKVFSSLFVNLLKVYYDIPFIIGRYENASLLTDDILSNLVTNLCFEMVVNSVNIYSKQLEMSILVKQEVYSIYKNKFKQLHKKPPEFFKVKDSFCLNTLTVKYIKLKFQCQDNKFDHKRKNSLKQKEENVVQLEEAEEVLPPTRKPSRLDISFKKIAEVEEKILKKQSVLKTDECIYQQKLLFYENQEDISYSYDDPKDIEDSKNNLEYQPYQKCINYLSKVSTEQKPMAKLRLIVKAFESIQKCVFKFYQQYTSQVKVNMGPEDLMDISVFILCSSQQYQLINDISLIRAFIPESVEYSEKTGYYLLTLDAAYQYIVDTDFAEYNERQSIRMSFSSSFRSFQKHEK